MNITKITKWFDEQTILATEWPVFRSNEEYDIESSREKSAFHHKYLRTSIIPFNTRVASVGKHGLDELRGIYQIDIFVPVENGIDESNYISDAILNHFELKTHIVDDDTCIRVVNRSPSISRKTDNLMMLVCEVEWSSHYQR